MIYDRDYIEKYIVKVVHPIRPDLDVHLLGAFDALAAGSITSSETLQALTDAASDRRASVYEISTEFIGELAGNDEKALEAIRGMATSEHAHVRHNAILCLSADLDPAVSQEIICERLKDKSHRVRRKAADWALRLNFPEVAPSLSAALKLETNQETRQVMQDALEALRKK